MDKKDAHNKGQTDASKGKFERPYTHTQEVISQGSNARQIHEKNAAYQQGHRNTTEQKKK